MITIGKKISRAEITSFSRQTATMLAAGIPLLQSLEFIIRAHHNPHFRTMLLQVKIMIANGHSIASALKKFPRYFNELYYNLISAGENSGALELIFNRLATYQEKTDQLIGKIKKALYYPITVMLIAFGVTLLMLVFIVPQFQVLFANCGAQLPAFTRFIIALSKDISRHWWLFILVSTFIIYFLSFIHQHSTQFAYAIDKIILRSPIIGNILKNAALARFARTLATTFAAGIPLVTALTLAANAAGNRVYTQRLLQVRETISSGQKLQSALRITQLFPDMLLQMIAIGEESGSLATMLDKTADLCETEVDQKVEGLSSLLEPIVMLILGIVIGGLVIAMYLPIFKLGTVV